MAQVFSGVSSPEEFMGWGAHASDMLLDALAEKQKTDIELRVTLAKIAGGAKVL